MEEVIGGEGEGERNGETNGERKANKKHNKTKSPQAKLGGWEVGAFKTAKPKKTENQPPLTWRCG